MINNIISYTMIVAILLGYVVTMVVFHYKITVKNLCQPTKESQRELNQIFEIYFFCKMVVTGLIDLWLIVMTVMTLRVINAGQADGL